MAGDIAVIGFSCRFGGEASDSTKLWDMLRHGRSAWSPISRFDSTGDTEHYGPNSPSPFAAYYISEDVYEWDAQFFGVSAKEANAIDPSQRLMLEVAYEALENCGIPLAKVRGTNTSCYIGQFVTDYREMIFRDPATAPRHTFTGTGTSNISNRVSWFFDLRGSSSTVNTACSSTLVALHEACESIRHGNAEMSLVGGANLILSPEMFQFQRQQNFLSADGRCKSFDASADGYGRGEGIAAMIVKPVQKAINDGDVIRAVIRGTGVNSNGGRGRNLTRPSVEAQVELIEKTYQSAGLDYVDTNLVEAHGTGTKAGDPSELEAIATTIGRRQREQGRELFVTSSKPNIGHTEATAGLGGVIKSILSLESDQIPPNIYLQALNSDLKLDEWGMQIPTSLMQWPPGISRRVSICSSGYGGTNAHAIIEGADGYLQQHDVLEMSRKSLSRSGIHRSDRAKDQSTQRRRKRMFILSSHHERGIRDLRGRFLHYLERTNDVEDETLLRDLAFTLSLKRSRFEWSWYTIASSLEELQSQLSVAGEVVDPGSSARKSLSSTPSLCFVFTGQGAQWPRMGYELYTTYDVFRQSVEAADAFFCTALGCSSSIKEQLFAPESSSHINDPAFSQPLCTVLQVALVDLLESWNVRSKAVVGHSSGEIAAAYCRGALLRQDAWMIAYYRGLLSSEMPKEFPNLKGAMLSVALPQDQAEQYLVDVRTDRSTLVVACINSPKNVTISGDVRDIEKLEDRLKAMNILTRRLQVATAYHSPHMELIATDYMQAIMDIAPRTAEDEDCTMISSVTGEIVDPLDLGPMYWMKHLISPVRFSMAIETVLKGQNDDVSFAVDAFTEIGPHSALQGSLKHIMAHSIERNLEYISVLSRGKDSVHTMLNAVGTLCSLGIDVDIGAVNGDGELSGEEGARMLIDLPPYPWSHDRVFRGFGRLEEENQTQTQRSRGLLGSSFPTIGKREHAWRSFISLDKHPWLRDHKIEDTILFPAAGHLVLAVEAAQELAEPDREVSAVRLRDIFLSNALVVPTEGTVELIVQLQPHSSSTREREGAWTEFTIASICGNSHDLSENCSGLLEVQYAVQPDSNLGRERSAQLQTAQRMYEDVSRSCRNEKDVSAFYEELALSGLNYGPSFANLKDVRQGEGQSCCSIKAHPWPVKLQSSTIHPATLDAMIHAIFAAIPELKGTVVPTLIDEAVIASMNGVGGLEMHIGSASVVDHGLREVKGDVHMFDERTKQLSIALHGIYLRSTGFQRTTFNEQAPRQICNSLIWQPVSQDGASHTASSYTNASSEITVLVDKNSCVAQDSLTELIVEHLKAQCIEVSVVLWDDMSSSIQAKTCISLVDIDSSGFLNASSTDFVTLQKLILRCESLLWVVDHHVSGSILAGLARTVRNEIPTLVFRTLEIDVQSMQDVETFASSITRLMLSPTVDYEFRITNSGELLVPKVVEDNDRNLQVCQIMANNEVIEDVVLGSLESMHPMKLTVKNPGMLDSLCLTPMLDYDQREPLVDDELEIEVQASGMNFRDIMVAMGKIPDSTFGFEASGKVIGVGKNVTRFQIGDRVCALKLGAHSSRFHTKDDFTQHVPPSISFETAATLLLGHATAYNAIFRIARAQRGQSILIHAAAGGVGQAAIQLAQYLGIHIFATVGSDEKRTLLKDTYDIPDEQILSSRDTSFAMAVQRLTNGRGVDIVLNSLAGESLRQSWHCIAPFGTFVEIGLRDIQNNSGLDMQPFAQDATFSFFNLARMMKERPNVVREILDGVFDLIQNDVLKPVYPITAFPISSVEQAYRKMQTGRHQGKLALTWDRTESVPALMNSRRKFSLRSDATYVLAGGTGGLGRSLALLLADLGAQHICFVSRSAGEATKTQKLISELLARGIKASAYKCDISESVSLSQAFQDLAQSHPPVRGVIQCAMLLQDTLFENMTYEQWRDCLNPKIQGSSNLDRLLGSDIDFFVMLSSFVGIFGNRTQGNYAAACAFQDALAQERRAKGQHAVSIDLGVMREVGYLAEKGSVGPLKEWEDPFGITEAELHALVRLAIAEDTAAQVITGFASGGAAAAAGIKKPYYLDDPKFSVLADSGFDGHHTADHSTSETPISDPAQIVAKSRSAKEAQQNVVEVLCARVAKSLQIRDTEIDSSRPLHAHGVDSLVAVEVRSWLFSSLKANISMFDLNSSMPITVLAQKISSVCELIPEHIRK